MATPSTSLEQQCQRIDEISLTKFEFSLIPEEVWLLIFRLLGPEDLLEARQVCSLWYRLTNTKTLWWNTRACIYGDMVLLQIPNLIPTVKLAHRLLYAAPALECLHIAFCLIDQCEILTSRIKARQLLQVRHLFIGHKTTLREEDFFEILRCLGSSLEGLHIGCALNIQWINGEKPFFGYLPALKSFSAACFEISHNPTMITWPRLENLQFSSEEFPKQTNHLFRMRNDLRRLSLAVSTSYPLTDVDRIVQFFPNLEKLGLFRDYQVDSDYPETNFKFCFSENNVSLSMLRYCGCWHDYKSCVQLWRLFESEISNIVSLKSVDNLIFFYNHGPTDIISNILITFTTLRNLTLMHVCGSSCESIPARGEVFNVAVNVLRYARSIKNLSLHGCEKYLDFDQKKLSNRFHGVKIIYKTDSKIRYGGSANDSAPHDFAF